MLKIVMMLKNTELKTLETDKKTITIGREGNSDIQINNLGVSKKHAAIIRQNGGYFIEDLKVKMSSPSASTPFLFLTRKAALKPRVCRNLP